MKKHGREEFLYADICTNSLYSRKRFAEYAGQYLEVKIYYDEKAQMELLEVIGNGGQVGYFDPRVTMKLKDLMKHNNPMACYYVGQKEDGVVRVLVVVGAVSINIEDIHLY